MLHVPRDTRPAQYSLPVVKWSSSIAMLTEDQFARPTNPRTFSFSRLRASREGAALSMLVARSAVCLGIPSLALAREQERAEERTRQSNLDGYLFLKRVSSRGYTSTNTVRSTELVVALSWPLSRCCPTTCSCPLIIFDSHSLALSSLAPFLSLALLLPEHRS